MKIIKRLSFTLLGFLLMILVTASILEKFKGADFVHTHIYGTVPFVLLWAFFVLISITYLSYRKIGKRPVVLLLHLSFVVILSGAFITWLYGKQGMLHLRKEEKTSYFVNKDMQKVNFPFEVSLRNFYICYYPGTSAPMDFVSELRIIDKYNQNQYFGRVAMNHVFSCQSYRFYQSGFDDDGQGTTLAVSYDPYGIAVTYTGYALLLLSMLLFMISRNSHFRTLIKSPLLRRGIGAVVLLFFSSGIEAAGGYYFGASNNKADFDFSIHSFEEGTSDVFAGDECVGSMPTLSGSKRALTEKDSSSFRKKDKQNNQSVQIQRKERLKVLPKDVAAQFGNLYVLYNNRICPLQTLAKDFTVKLCGSSSYKGLTVEQVYTGWLFYYSSWKKQPVFKVKSGEVCRLLGIDGHYASLNGFFNDENEYKLGKVLDEIRIGKPVKDKRGIEEADEKYNMITMLYSGKAMNIFPYIAAETSICMDSLNRSDFLESFSNGRSPVKWFSQNDRLPDNMKDGQQVFIRKYLDYIHENVLGKNFKEVSRLLSKLRVYQQKEAAGSLPSSARFDAEKIYNKLVYTKLLAMVCVVVGLLSFVYYCQRSIVRKHPGKIVVLAGNLLLVLLFIYLTLVVGLRGYVSNHLPLSNGFETMQFMAWCTLLITFLLQRKFSMILPFGFLMCGLALMVAMMGESNPPITQLMPVLASPLLSVHVVVIMLAYSLLAFIMLNGIMALILHYSPRDCSVQIERLQIISQLLLYPAVFLLTIGIFIGAIWANVSWGRYWGWDPKEVWALITMLVYALALHPDSLPWFRRPMFFHIFSIVAFLTVLITYFGVNFLLGGMHSYAVG